MPRLGPRGGGGHSGFPTQPSFWWGSWTSVQREKRFIVSGMGFSPGFSNPALKRMIKSTLSRNAEALLPPAEAGGSHQLRDSSLGSPLGACAFWRRVSTTNLKGLSFGLERTGSRAVVSHPSQKGAGESEGGNKERTPLGAALIIQILWGKFKKCKARSRRAEQKRS